MIQTMPSKGNSYIIQSTRRKRKGLGAVGWDGSFGCFLSTSLSLSKSSLMHFMYVYPSVIPLVGKPKIVYIRLTWWFRANSSIGKTVEIVIIFIHLPICKLHEISLIILVQSHSLSLALSNSVFVLLTPVSLSVFILFIYFFFVFYVTLVFLYIKAVIKLWPCVCLQVCGISCSALNILALRALVQACVSFLPKNLFLSRFIVCECVCARMLSVFLPLEMLLEKFMVMNNERKQRESYMNCVLKSPEAYYICVLTNKQAHRKGLGMAAPCNDIKSFG